MKIRPIDHWSYVDDDQTDDFREDKMMNSRHRRIPGNLKDFFNQYRKKSGIIGLIQTF